MKELKYTIQMKVRVTSTDNVMLSAG